MPEQPQTSGPAGGENAPAAAEAPAAPAATTGKRSARTTSLTCGTLPLRPGPFAPLGHPSEYPTALCVPFKATKMYIHKIDPRSQWEVANEPAITVARSYVSSAITSGSTFSHDIPMFPHLSSGNFYLATCRFYDHVILINRECCRMGFPPCPAYIVEAGVREMADIMVDKVPYPGAQHAVIVRVTLSMHAYDPRAAVPDFFFLRFSAAAAGPYCPEGRAMSLLMMGFDNRSSRPAKGTENMPDLPLVKGPQRILLRRYYRRAPTSGIIPNAVLLSDPFNWEAIDEADCGKLVLIYYEVVDISTLVRFAPSAADPEARSAFIARVHEAMETGSLSDLAFENIRVVIAESSVADAGIAGAVLRDALAANLPKVPVVCEKVTATDLPGYAEALTVGTTARINPVREIQYISEKEHNFPAVTSSVTFVNGYFAPVAEQVVASVQKFLTVGDSMRQGDFKSSEWIIYPALVMENIAMRSALTAHVAQYTPNPRAYVSSKEEHMCVVP